MGKEIKRICLEKLSSENGVFDEIIFHDGINLILGEKYDDSSIKGRKTNGVGKSMCIEFIDFTFLCDYSKSRIAKIPKEVLPEEEDIILELTIGEESVTIKRNRKNQEKPIFYHENKRVQFNKLADAREYLRELIFGELTGKNIPSVRNLLSILIRDEKSEFSDILKCHDLTRRIPDDLTVHLYMLDISLDNYKKVLDTIREVDKTTTALNKIKKELTDNGSKKISDVKAELNELDGELVQLEEAIETFKTNDAFSSIETELVEIENQLDQLRGHQKILKLEYDKIRSLPKPEQVDDTEIELVYNQFKENLGNTVVKSLNEVVGFKNKVEQFQRVLINQKARELEKQIADISGKIRNLDDQYARKIQIVDKKGVLKNLKTGLRIYESKREAAAHTQLLFDQYDQYDKQRRQLNIRKQEQLLHIDDDIEAMANELKSFKMTISDIHESIMGNRECSFDIKAQPKGQSKIPLEIDLRIFDDGSRSVNRTKVFIYDMALMFNEYTSNRHPRFLVHDNIFDVDQDTLVQCLNYIYKQEEYDSGFQYILTLNRDKIENEERRKLIKMDVDAHEVAIFTKKKKFLKRDYQEK
ncbi:MAG: DUF2326 domain-containing protein [Lachnospiraceae bacterium]|jgi:uncharacterized protein YydD (DUF2326 family)